MLNIHAGDAIQMWVKRAKPEIGQVVVQIDRVLVQSAPMLPHYLGQGVLG